MVAASLTKARYGQEIAKGSDLAMALSRFSGGAIYNPFYRLLSLTLTRVAGGNPGSGNSAPGHDGPVFKTSNVRKRQWQLVP